MRSNGWTASALSTDPGAQKHQNEAMAQPTSPSTARVSSALPWSQRQALQLPEALGQGLNRAALQAGLEQLIACDGVAAVVLFGSRAQGTARPDSDLDLAVICREAELNNQLRSKRWRTYRAALGGLGCGIDLVLQGQVDAATLSGSRWHVMKDVARHGVVLYASL